MIKKIFVLALVLLVLASISYAVEKSMVKIGGNVVVEKGETVKDAVAVGGSVTVNGRVEGSAVAVGGDVKVGSGGRIVKDAVSIGGTITKASGAVVGGNIVELPVMNMMALPVLGKGMMVAFIGGIIILKIMVFIGLLALAILAVALFAREIGVVSFKIERELWKSLGIGILGAIITPVLVVILAISIVGIILIPVLIFLVVIAGLHGYIAVSQLVGKKVLQAFKKYNQPMMTEAIIGVVIFFLMFLIPLIGPAVKALAATIGFGAVIATRFGTK